MQKAGSVPDVAEDGNKPIEYEQNPNSSQSKPAVPEEVNEEDEEQTEEPIQEEPEVVQVISRRKEAAGTQKRFGTTSQDTGRGAEASEAFFPRQGRTIRQQTPTPPLSAVHT